MSTEITIKTSEQLERHILATVALADNPQTPAHIAKLATQRAYALTCRLDAPEFNGQGEQVTKVIRIAA